MNDKNKASQSKTDKELMEYLNNPSIPKTEAEHFGIRKIGELQAKNQSLQGEVRLWRKRVDEAANAIETFEQLQAENKQLKEKIM